jgi:ubiquinol-cytochrome c reductase cytochrome b subunit
MTPLVARLLHAIDERVSVGAQVQRGANKVFPRHWSFLLGEVALIAFGILVVTGVFLAAFYRPVPDPVVYEGSATLFDGRALPGAFESIVRLSHDVPGGLFIRRVHRITATVFIMAIALHLVRIVLTGAFRKPREPNYHLGLVLIFLAVASGYSGHNLIWDVLSGTSLRILYTFFQSIPFVGEAVAQWAFGGEFPTGALLPRLYVVHVVILPALIAAGIGLHMWLVVRQTHTQFPQPGVDEATTVVGEPTWPQQFATTTTLGLTVAAIIAAAAALVPWADSALHGPYMVAAATNASQPDWFLFWIEGALRLYPGWEWEVAGTVISGVFIVGVVGPLAVGAVLFGYPALERLIVGRYVGSHHEAQGPFDVPFRFGFVAALVTLFAILTLAAGHDVLARLLGASIESVTWALRVLVIVAPVAVGVGCDLYSRHRRKAGR